MLSENTNVSVAEGKPEAAQLQMRNTILLSSATSITGAAKSLVSLSAANRPVNSDRAPCNKFDQTTPGAITEASQYDTLFAQDKPSTVALHVPLALVCGFNMTFSVRRDLGKTKARPQP